VFPKLGTGNRNYILSTVKIYCCDAHNKNKNFNNVTCTSTISCTWDISSCIMYQLRLTVLQDYSLLLYLLAGLSQDNPTEDDYLRVGRALDVAFENIGESSYT
jgi:hypothetical protein